VSAFRDGLKEAGFIDGHNVAIEFRWAENKLDRLPALAADLVQRHVTMIFGTNLTVRAARAATSTIAMLDPPKLTPEDVKKLEAAEQQRQQAK
jgi:hypothetical protein